MKLIITGATGFVAGEIIRQSLRMAEITEIIALARKPVTVPAGPNAAKLKSVVVEDYDKYPEDLKKEFAGADACIWTVAITPSKSKAFDFDEVRRVCHTSTLVGLRAMYEAGPAKPFRFLYMSGVSGERDQTKTPRFMPQYTLMRGETESAVLAFAAEHAPDIEPYVAKPGLVTKQGDLLRTVAATVLKWIGVVPNVDVESLVAAMLDLVVHGSKTETMLNDELRVMGQKILQDQTRVGS